MNKNPKVTKLDPREMMKRCLDEDTDSVRVSIIGGADLSVKAEVVMSNESMSVLGQDPEGNKKPLAVNSEGKLLIELPKEILEALNKPVATQQVIQAEPQKLECNHQVSLQPLPQEYLDRLEQVTKALNEVAINAAREVIKETVREIPVEKIVEKHIVTKEVPKWVWILVGAQAAALLISVL